jgi:hypothetical protein
MEGPLNSSRYHDNRHPNDRHHDRPHHRHNHEQHNQRNGHKGSRSRSRSRDRFTKRNNNQNQNQSMKNAVTTNKTDPNLPQMNDDPRPSDPSKRISNKALSQSKGRNTESFHAESTFVRPDLRVQIGSSKIEKYNKVLKHDDVVIVPEMFGGEDDWSIYYSLVKEMREIQDKEKNKENKNANENQNNGNNRNGRGNKNHISKSEWIPWHEGAHLISKKPDESSTYQSIVKRLCEYFDIDTGKPVGTRFNWYRDSNDWKV